MQCDRLFGRIRILSPSVHHEVYKKHCEKVFVYQTDWNTFIWKEQYGIQFKVLPNIQKAKIIILKRENLRSGNVGIMVRNEKFYSIDCNANCICLLKKDATYSEISPAATKGTRRNSEAKVNDILNFIQLVFGENFRDNPRFEVYCIVFRQWM